jgi:hypothetical protein
MLNWIYNFYHTDRSKSNLNVSRGISNSSKKSIHTNKDDFRDRVQRLKDKLDSTKNTMRQRKESINQRYNQTATFFSSNKNANNYTVVNDGNVSPTSLGGTSSCGNYQINHVRCNTAGLSNSMHPHMANSDMNKVQNLSYYSSVSNANRKFRPDFLPDYKRDGATLIVDRIKKQLRKSFKPLKNLFESGKSNNDMKFANKNSLNASYTTIQPEINRQRNLRNNSKSNSRLASNSRRSLR